MDDHEKHKIAYRNLMSNLMAEHILRKESDMNTILIHLEDGPDILTKTMEMTDAQIKEIGETRFIGILERAMKVAHLQLDSDPKWVAHVVFKQETDKRDCCSKKEFVELLGEGWTLDI